MTIRHLFTCIGLAVLCLLPTVAGQQRADAEVLFQSALYKEQVELKLQEAIAGYKDVVAAAGTDKAIAAKALLRMAECYERLGDPAAMPTYQRIVSEYAAGGADVVTARVTAAARAKLVPADQESSRQALATLASSVSSDGRYLVLAEAGNLVVHDMRSGRRTALTTDGSTGDTYAFNISSMSPDGRWIAYVWRHMVDGSARRDIRVIRREGGQPRTLLAQEPGPRSLTAPIGWSPDGQWVFVDSVLRSSSGPLGTKELLKVPVQGGPYQVAAQFPNLSADNATVSPDGRWLAYDRTDGRLERDLYVLSLETGRETLVHKHEANDYVLGWFPDGIRLLFGSDRDGTFGVWALNLRNAVAQGEPVSVRAGTEQLDGIGFTRNGEFYYSLSTPGRHIWEASLDRPSTPNRLQGRYTGGMNTGSYSPAGDRLAYAQDSPGSSSASVGGAVQSTTTLGIQNIASGAVTLVRPALRNFANPSWFNDGRRVMVNGSDLEGRQGLFIVEVDSGAVTSVAAGPPTALPPNTGLPVSIQLPSEPLRVFPSVSSDGRQAFFAMIGPPNSSVMARDLSTGQERTVFSGSSRFELSPDGRFVVVFAAGGKLLVVPSEGGEPRLLWTQPGGWRGLEAACWSADGQSIFFSREESRERSSVWQIPLAGAEPRNTGIGVPARLTRISADPRRRSLLLSGVELTRPTMVLRNIPGVRGR